MATFSLLTDEEKAELWSCLALKHSRGLGYHSANALIEHYGSAFEAVELGRRAPGCWVSEGFVSERTAKTFAKESWREKARHEWEALQHPGRHFLYRTHPHYPHLLAEIHDAPLIVYYNGDIRLLANPMVGVVGSRRCSEEGILACATLARQLASFGVTIVSGLAKGIDRAAHIAGLSALGSSVAVLGTGIDVVYPESNEDVYGVLQEKGLILSEFCPGTAPHAKNFPIRNRIISGLSRGVIIVEATKRSGSLITARLALEQGRDVFAIPGSNLGNHSEGCHELIRNGAKPVFSAEDVIFDLAPLLSIDVNAQLARLKQSEPVDNLRQYANLLSEKNNLPPLLESTGRGQKKGYHYKQGVAESRGVNPGVNSGVNSGVNADMDPDINPDMDPDMDPDMNPDMNPDMSAGPKNTIINNAASNNTHFNKNFPSSDSEDTHFHGTLCEESSSEASTPDAVGGSALSDDGSELEQRILLVLGADWRHIDWLGEQLHVDSGQVSTALTMLEVNGLVVQKTGMFYRLP